MQIRILLHAFLLFLLASPVCAGTVFQHTIKSKALENTALGINSDRHAYVYVPDNYESSSQSYPVIYYLTSFEQKLDEQVVGVIDDAIAEGDLPPTLFVSADFRMKHGLNFFGNNEVVGRWLDFIHEDLRSTIESKYRVKRGAEHRAVSGHFLGGYAAIKLAMLYPDTYGSVYALHPVATDFPDQPMIFKPDWNEIHAAENYSQLKAPASGPYVSMAQAHLPNPQKPPFYADFIVELVDGEPKLDVAHMRKLKQVFHLADFTAEHAENLQKLRGIGFDWGRNDSNYDHVIGARRYSVLLENFGIEHSTEEHQGNGWDYEFTLDGKIRTRMLPFLGRLLVY